ELPLTEKKAHAVRETQSPLTQLAWLFALACIGFTAVTVVIWFGPRAVEYAKGFSGQVSSVPPKPSPWAMPEFKPAIPDFTPLWFSESHPPFRPPPIPQSNIRQGNGIPAPSPGGGVQSSRFTIHR